MKLFLRIFILSLIIMSPNVFAEDKAENAKGKNLKVAIVNFQKVVVESDLGKKFIKSQRSNIEKKQSILGKLEDQVRKMRDSYEEKRLVLDEKARDEMGEELAYKIKELQRKREDFEVEVKIADSRFQRQIMRAVMKEVKTVSEQLGYDMVFSSQAPGLMYLNPSLDITDKVLEQLND